MKDSVVTICTITFIFIILIYLICSGGRGGPGFECVTGDCENGYGEMKIGTCSKEHCHRTKGLFKHNKLIKGINFAHKECKIKGEFESYSYYRIYRNGYIEEDCNGIIVEGYFELGLPKGYSTMTFADGKSFSVGTNEEKENLNSCVIGDCVNGFGLLVVSTGYYVGEFKDGVIIGNSISETHIYDKEYYEIQIVHKNQEKNSTIRINKEGKKVGKIVNEKFQE